MIFLIKRNGNSPQTSDFDFENVRKQLHDLPGGGEGIPRKGMPRPPSTLQHFSLIAQSSSAILSILVCDFLFQLTPSVVIVLFLLRLHAVTTPVYGFSIVIKLSTLKLIVHCKLTAMNSFKI